MKKKTFVVRLWVDVEIPAETKEEAKKIANNVPVSVQPFGIYEIQVENVWKEL